MTIWLTGGANFIRANYIPDWLVDYGSLGNCSHR